MMRRGGSVGPPDPYQSRPSPGYYYSRGTTAAGQPSPSHSHNSATQQQQQQQQQQQRAAPMSQPIVRRQVGSSSSDYNHHPHPQHHRQPSEQMTPRSENGRLEDVTPSYYVEHLATFAVGRQFGLTFPADGIRKLKQMEKNSAIWAQPLILRFRHNSVTVEDDNGELVEQFPLELIEQPTAHVSNDPRDTYNNILLFVVRENRKRLSTPTEMHIFQCIRVAATEVADDLQAFTRGQHRRIRPGRRTNQPPQQAQQQQHPVYHHQAQQQQQQQMPYYAGDDASISSETSEMFERDVNTLNRCFDDIERFVARIQSAALAQREIEQQNYRYRTANRRDKKSQQHQQPDPNGILFMRAQLPIESEFVDILKKFKLSFNLLAKLKNHIHEPNAPELLHFLFTPLSVILEACHWGLGRNIGPTVVAPLLSLEARELMQNCLTSRESDVWMSLGEAWRTPPEDWTGPLPAPFRPVFSDGFAPYGVVERNIGGAGPNPLHRGQSAPPEHYRGRSAAAAAERSAIDTLEFDRLTLERERLEFEKAKILERESRLRAEEKQIEDEKRRLNAEKELIKKETHVDDVAPITKRYDAPISSSSPAPQPRQFQHVKVSVDADTSPRQQAFIDDVVARGGKLAIVTYDRSGQNAKELTVHKGEYLEVLYDVKNWWECKNMHQRVGYVPHTILSMVPFEQQQYASPNLNSTSISSYSSAQQQAPNGHHAHHALPHQAADVAVQVSATPVAPPAPTMEDLLRTQKLRTRPVVATSPPLAASPTRRGIEVVRRRENPALVGELSETLSRNQGDVLRPATRGATRVAIDEKSSAEDVARWLQEKGFSPRVIDLLDGQDGANLFSLQKLHLQQACGRDEGSYLYSQLLVQKNRSGYRTHTGDELKAILNQRKTHVELSNETPADEPTFTINH